MDISTNNNIDVIIQITLSKYSKAVCSYAIPESHFNVTQHVACFVNMLIEEHIHIHQRMSDGMLLISDL